MRKSIFLALVLSISSACSSSKENEELYFEKATEGFSTLSSDPVYTLTAEETEKQIRPGEKTVVWAYNGEVPGPTLHAKVGDLVTIHFKNRLPVPSTIHWHGMEVPAGMDGSPLSQIPVPPGGNFTYQFRVNRAATYWYHSHVDNAVQIEKGLHGGLIVHDPDENKALQMPEKEMNFLLDDILLDNENQIVGKLPSNPVDRAVYLTNGREGNLLLVNGVHQPHYRVQHGIPLRLRFVNVANARFMRLNLPGQVIFRIGGDTGLLEEPLQIQQIGIVPDPVKPIQISDSNPDHGIMLAPGERAELFWIPDASHGELARLEWHDFPRGRHTGHLLPDGVIDLLPDNEDGRLPRQILASFLIEKNSPFENLESMLPSKLRVMDSLKVSSVENPEPLRVIFGHGPGDEKGNVMFFARAIHDENGMKALPMMKLTNETALNAMVGESRIIEVKNMSRGIHPFHIHGFVFELLETEYVNLDKPDDPILNRVLKNNSKNWREQKDTIQVPGRNGYRMRSWTIMRLLVSFKDENRAGTLAAYGGKFKDGLVGGWLAHCHILEHAAFGMGTWINLWPRHLYPKEKVKKHGSHGHHSSHMHH